MANITLFSVYISPLAKYPGPKLAGTYGWFSISVMLTSSGLTTLYQAYYDVCLGGKFFKKLEQLHKVYGTIALR
jgi:hypothetical protein